MGRTKVPDRLRSEVESAYDAIASEYDSHYADPVSEAENDLVGERLAHVLDSVPLNTPILDLGCGTGLALDLAWIEPERYMGYDLSLGMLKVAQARFPAYWFACRDMNDALETFQQGTVGAIVSLFGSFNHLEYVDMARLMRVAGRTLVPGGKLLLVVTGPRRGQPSYLSGGAELRHLKASELFALGKIGGLHTTCVRGFSFGLSRYARPGAVSTVLRAESAVLGRVLPSLGHYMILEAERRG